MPLGKTRAPKSDGWGQTGLNYTALQGGKSSFQPLAAAPASRRHLTRTDQYKSTPLICAKHSERVTSSDRSYLIWQVLDLTYHLSSYVKHRIRINFILRAPIPQNVITCLGLSQVRSVLLFDLLSHRIINDHRAASAHTNSAEAQRCNHTRSLMASAADRYRQAEPQSPADKRPAFSALRCTRGTGESSSACTAKAVGFTAEDKLVA